MGSIFVSKLLKSILAERDPNWFNFDLIEEEEKKMPLMLVLQVFWQTYHANLDETTNPRYL